MAQLVSGLRTTLYPYLAPIANVWHERMDISERYPTTHLEYLEICRRAGQTIPTSMLLDHGVGQRSLLHQDLYRAHSFALQVAILLSTPIQEIYGVISCRPLPPKSRKNPRRP